MKKSLYINYLDYSLGDTCHDVDTLASEGLTSSSAEFLRSVGFERVYSYNEPSNIFDSTLRLMIAGSKTVCPTDVYFYSGIDQDNSNEDLFGKFTYDSSRLMHESGMNGVRQMALHQSGCSGPFEMIRLALNSTSDNSRVMCVLSDMIPTGEGREVQYNLMSDSVSVIGFADDGWLRVVDVHTVYAQQFWNTSEDIEKITASYFTFAVRCLSELLDRNAMTADDINLVIPHNVSLRSWQILCELTGITIEKVYTDNIKRLGHTVSSDLVINLVDAKKAGRLQTGMKIMAFTYGFGSSWSATLLEVV